jgi:putative effector of murein hydrolase
LITSVLFIGVVFGGIAAIMAFLISYEEYMHHFPDRKTVIRMSLEPALLAFAVFLVLGVILAVTLPRVV